MYEKIMTENWVPRVYTSELKPNIDIAVMKLAIKEKATGKIL